MKIRGLNIESHQQLQGLKLNFTYPEGHDKAGMPLQKICLVGQSATGKTTILEIIKENILRLSSIEILENGLIFNGFGLSFKGNMELQSQNSPLVLENDRIIFNGREFPNMSGNGGGIVENFIEKYAAIKLLYISAEVISREAIAFFNQNPVGLLNSFSDKKNNRFPIQQSSNYVYEFVQEAQTELWISLLNRILDYRKRFTQLASELINKGAIGDPNKLNTEYARWSLANENPLLSFAKYFNPVLEKLSLEVDLVNTEYPIPIKSKTSGEVIPIGGLSTGTKGLLLSMFPLFELDNTDSIILLDEPERSLFPDIQVELMSYFQQIAPAAQLFVATHSPFIAAAFEPEERFVLYFDKEGRVKVRQGESPVGDDPNDILRNDFNVDYYNQFGKDAHQRYLDLKRKIEQETEPGRKNELIVELAALGDKYNF